MQGKKKRLKSRFFTKIKSLLSIYRYDYVYRSFC